MKKIGFKDDIRLTGLVLLGVKKMTRRLEPCLRPLNESDPAAEFSFSPYDEKRGVIMVEVRFNGVVAACYQIAPRFRSGEVVAVAQSLRDMGYDPHAKDWNRGDIWGLDHTPAWTNKMFVSPSKCIHRIRMNGVKIERLQDISDEDCFAEGVGQCLVGTETLYKAYETDRGFVTAPTPKEAFGALFKKVSRRGVWESNPFVLAYSFELIQ